MAGYEACAACGVTRHAVPTLHYCGKCRNAAYCNVACQRAHWKFHKRTCDDIAAQQNSARHHLAESGDVGSMGSLGYLHASGIGGVRQDAVRGVAWFRRAAESPGGDVVAEFNLGLCYEDGNGVARDAAEASRWYLSAAKAGYAAARYRLARAYELGDGVTQNADTSRYWLKLAAKDNYSDAQYALGMRLIASGEVDQGKRWLRAAAAQGHAQAIAALAVFKLPLPGGHSASGSVADRKM